METAYVTLETETRNHLDDAMARLDCISLAFANDDKDDPTLIPILRGAVKELETASSIIDNDAHRDAIKTALRCARLWQVDRAMSYVRLIRFGF